jgi:hypothetical protein
MSSWRSQRSRTASCAAVRPPPSPSSSRYSLGPERPESAGRRARVRHASQWLQNLVAQPPPSTRGHASPPCIALAARSRSQPAGVQVRAVRARLSWLAAEQRPRDAPGRGLASRRERSPGAPGQARRCQARQREAGGGRAGGARAARARSTRPPAGWSACGRVARRSASGPGGAAASAASPAGCARPAPPPAAPPCRRTRARSAGALSWRLSCARPSWCVPEPSQAAPQAMPCAGCSRRHTRS